MGFAYRSIVTEEPGETAILVDAGPPIPLTGAPVPPTGPPTRPATHRRRRGLGVRLGLGLAGVLTLVGGPGAMAVDRGWWPAHDSALTVHPSAAAKQPAGAGVVQAPAARAHSPRPGDPAVTRHAWARAQIQTVLDQQAKALLRGDQTGFLAPADPAASALLDTLRRRFTALRAMNIAGWTETLAADPSPVDGGWQASVKIGYCFGEPGCTPVAIPVPTRWAETGGPPRLVEFGASGGPDLGPRPWEVTELRVAIGSRVVVAAPPRYAGRVPALLEAAEEAAAVTDRYARWATPPGRYLVFLAGPDEWTSWYGVHQADWVAGYAMPITERDTEIVLNGQRVNGGEVVDTLRHEFTHVVALAGVTRDYSGQWWLVEGIAEYVRMVGRPLRDYELLNASRRYVRQGNPTDLASLAEPPADASTEDASARYGVAFLTVRRLAERFGEDKMLQFFEAVVRQGAPAADVSTTIFGTDWAEIIHDCAAYVKRNLD